MVSTGFRVYFKGYRADWRLRRLKFWDVGHMWRKAQPLPFTHKPCPVSPWPANGGDLPG